MITNSRIAILNYNNERKMVVDGYCNCFIQETIAEKATARTAIGFEQDAYTHCFIPKSEIEKEQIKRNSIVIKLDNNDKELPFTKISGLSQISGLNYFKVKEVHFNDFGSPKMQHFEVVLDV